MLSQMPPVILCIAFGPLAAYLLVLGVVNLSSKPFLTTGGRDFAALAIGLSGLVMVGPADLFMPAAAALQFGPYVWVLMGSLYVFGCTLLVLYQQPRLVVYNVSPDELRPTLDEAARSLDPEAKLVGSHLLLPGLGLEVQMESFAPMRNVSLVSVGERHHFGVWRHFERTLAEALRGMRVGVNPRGVSFVLIAAFVGVMLFWNVAAHPETVTQDLYNFLRMEIG